MIIETSIAQIWKSLRAKYEVLRADKPLAIGTDKALQTLHPEYTDKQIQAVLRRHTRTDTYLRNVKFGDRRFTLDSVPFEPITDVQRELARLHLNERSQKRLIVKLDQIKPAKTEKKRLAREAKHRNRLIRIQNKFKAVKNLLNAEHVVCQAELDGVTKLAGN